LPCADEPLTPLWLAPVEMEQLPDPAVLMEIAGPLALEANELQALAASLLPFLAFTSCGVNILGIMRIVARAMTVTVKNTTFCICQQMQSNYKGIL
jgi:hypothetical protein